MYVLSLSTLVLNSSDQHKMYVLSLSTLVLNSYDQHKQVDIVISIHQAPQIF